MRWHWFYDVHIVYVAAITRVADYTESSFVVLARFIILILLIGVVLWLMPRSAPDGQRTS